MTGLARPHRLTCPCGWSGSYPTLGYAEKARRLHSCDRDWSPKVCEHTARHEHGTAAAYTHCGCRCEPCRTATADAEATRVRARAYGRSNLVDAAPARAHVQGLVGQGMSLLRIAQISGVDRSMLTRLTVGKTRSAGRREIARRIARTTEARILAVTWDPADGGRPVNGDSTTRRLRALVAAGWWTSELSRRTGWDTAYIERLLRGRPVRPGTARRVHALYGELADTPPPPSPYATRARHIARSRGWQPPSRLGGRVIAGRPLETPDDREDYAA